MTQAKKEAATAAVEETDAERFVRLAVKRTRHAVKDIALIGNLGAPQYESTPEQRKAVQDALTSALTDALRRLNGVKSTVSEFSL